MGFHAVTMPHPTSLDQSPAPEYFRHQHNFTYKNLPPVSVFAADIFSHYRFLDICWVLGGMVCGTECGCVNPQVSIIQDAL